MPGFPRPFRSPQSELRIIQYRFASNPDGSHESQLVASMNNPARLLLALFTIFALTASGRAQTPPPTKPGYNVVVEISYDEAGKPIEGKVVQSDDPTGDHILDQVAMNMAGKDAQPPKMVDGKAVPFKARRPFN